jgi:hypothetical protein
VEDGGYNKLSNGGGNDWQQRGEVCIFLLHPDSITLTASGQLLMVRLTGASSRSHLQHWCNASAASHHPDALLDVGLHDHQQPQDIESH